MNLTMSKAKIQQLGNIAAEKSFKNPQRGRIYSTDGICPTLSTCSGGDLEPKVLVNVEVKDENSM